MSPQERRPYLTLLGILSLGLTAIALFISRPGSRDLQIEPKGLMVRYWYVESDVRLPATALTSRPDNWKYLSGSRVSSTKTYLYLWLSIRNENSLNEEYVFTNPPRNDRTEFMTPGPLGASVTYSHGDEIPSGQSPIRHTRAAFPIHIEQGITAEYVVEYYGVRGITAQPGIVPVSVWLNEYGKSREKGALVTGTLLLLIAMHIAIALTFRRKKNAAIALFGLAVTFLFLRQSRILLVLIDPLTYQPWLYPLSITLNLFGAIVLSRTVLGERLGRFSRNWITAVPILAAVMTIFSGWGNAYVVADTLNLLSLATVVVLVMPLVSWIRGGSEEASALPICMFPWLVTMFIDIFVSFAAVTPTDGREYRQALGLAATLFMLAVDSFRGYGTSFAERLSGLEARIGELRRDRERGMAELSSLRAGATLRIAHEMRSPAESIAAIAGILEREIPEATVLAATRLIRASLAKIHATLGDFAAPPPREEVIGEAIETLLGPAEGIGHAPHKVVIHTPESGEAERVALILGDGGFNPALERDRYRVLELAERGEIDLLIVEGRSGLESTLNLCRIIRAYASMIALPILMIVDYSAEGAMSRGSAAGINDFLTKPYSVVELSVRVRTLLRLREIASMNVDLAESEAQKKSFLYFLTHNINTPLTLMINRVRELEWPDAPDRLGDVAADLRLATEEINDIVQNVLISFRLADSRHTLRIEPFDPKPALDKIRELIDTKAEQKGQTVHWDLELEGAYAFADEVAFRGIVHNLVDNAVKFTPQGGTIEVIARASGHLSLRVSDSGPGIPEESLPRLFGRFERLGPRPTGGESSTGLGLYIARELARLNEGSLSLCAPNRQARLKGACFELTMPLAPNEEEIG